MGRVAKPDTGRLSAVREARAKQKLAIEEAKQKVADFIARETQSYYDELIDAIRLALIEGHSARQIGQAYGSSDPHTIRKLVEDAGFDDSKITGQSSLNVKRVDDKLVVNIVAFGTDKRTGQATFVVDEDGENITAVDGDLWVQSVLYREGAVQEVLSARR